LVLGCRDRPDIEIVAGTRSSGRQETRDAHLADQIRAGAVSGVEYLQRPCDIDRTQFQIVGGVRLSVGSALIPDGLKLLVAPEVLRVAERRQSRLRLDFYVVDTIIDRQGGR